MPGILHAAWHNGDAAGAYFWLHQRQLQVGASGLAAYAMRPAGLLHAVNMLCMLCCLPSHQAGGISRSLPLPLPTQKQVALKPLPSLQHTPPAGLPALHKWPPFCPPAGRVPA